MDFLSGERAWWRRPIGVAIVLLLMVTTTAVRSRTSAGAATTPAGFTDDAVWSGLVQPTAIAFAADGRVFVAEKGGVIKLFASRAATAPTVFADLSPKVNSYWDR